MRPFPERNRRNRDFLHGVACGVCLVSGSLTINDMMRRKGTPRCGDEKNAPCRPKGTERRRSAVPLSCFTRSGQYRGPYGGHCPSRSRTHLPSAAKRAAYSRWRPLSVCLAQVLFPFIAVSIFIILPTAVPRVNRRGNHSFSLKRKRIKKKLLRETAVSRGSSLTMWRIRV